MGMVVDHAWVDKVISMSDDFCLYDDYNWDWTLMHLSAEIIKPATTRAWKGALPAMARSQHMGITGCGTHFQKGKICPPIFVRCKYLFQVVVTLSRYEKCSKKISVRLWMLAIFTQLK